MVSAQDTAERTTDAAPEPHVNRGLLIDGRLATAEETFPSMNPATGVIIGHAFGADSPFGGFKRSGVGRQMGVAGREERLESKTFAVPAAPSGRA